MATGRALAGLVASAASAAAAAAVGSAGSVGAERRSWGAPGRGYGVGGGVDGGKLGGRRTPTWGPTWLAGAGSGPRPLFPPSLGPSSPLPPPARPPRGLRPQPLRPASRRQAPPRPAPPAAAQVLLSPPPLPGRAGGRAGRAEGVRRASELASAVTAPAPAFSCPGSLAAATSPGRVARGHSGAGQSVRPRGG